MKINNIVNSLKSFYDRRIKISVNSKSLVLDIGSGDKPHWRSDVLLDKYIGEEFGIQRSGSKKVEINKPIFDGDAENMPFKDKVFDFVICSHLLEYVVNPDKVINEIIRVGKAGYIELPYEGSSKLLDFPSHLWYCKKEGNTLVFTAKDKIIFDNEIDKFITKSKLNFCKDFDNCIIQLHWNDKIDYKILGEANLGIFDDIKNINIEGKRNNVFFLVRNILNSIFSLIFFYKKRKKDIFFNDIVKEKLKSEKDFILEKKIYKI